MNGMLNRPGRGLLVVVSAVAVACAPQPDVAADLVLRNGKVVTVDEANPEGTAIAMAGDTILAVGSDEEENLAGWYIDDLAISVPGS